jgi:hypothetical protein
VSIARFHIHFVQSDGHICAAYVVIAPIAASAAFFTIGSYRGAPASSVSASSSAVGVPVKSASAAANLRPSAAESGGVSAASVHTGASTLNGLAFERAWWPYLHALQASDVSPASSASPPNRVAGRPASQLHAPDVFKSKLNQQWNEADYWSYLHAQHGSSNRKI